MAGDVTEPEGDSAEEFAGGKPPGSFPIVGIGGSAGALEAARDLLRNLPADTGMGFVYVQHLDPTRKSILADIFSRETRMPVAEATEGLRVSPNHVYILPPNRTMVTSGGVLRLAERLLPAGLHLPIDEFLRSLAEDQGASGIAIVLSGASSDGALGLQAVKQSGGITFAQDDSAKHATMPHHAINTGAVDFVLPPRGIAEELERIARHPYVRNDREEWMRVFPPGAESCHRDILAALHAQKGTDFSAYRPSTLKRRIARRMALRHIERIEDYASVIREDKEELDALFNEVLINVTSFFRDPQTFAALAEQLLSRLVKDRPRDQPIRVWVPACSTGEEAFSLAIALIEAFGAESLEHPVQIFGTDVSQRAINRARAGVFVENISMDVSAERLERFFRKTDDHYRIIKSVRDLCIFARHDITTDPPFSNLDLVTCRNLLIYMSPELQGRVLDRLHYALKPGGYLVVGSSESLFQYQEMFSVIDAKHRFFSKIGGSGNHMALAKARLPAGRERLGYRSGSDSDSDMIAEADRVLFARDGQSGVLIQGSSRILQFRGDTSRYLAPVSGPASFDLLKMARPELRMPLQAALQKARDTGQPVGAGEIQVRSERGYDQTSIDVIPINLPGAGPHYLVLFEAVQSDRGDVTPERHGDRREVIRLQQQLAATTEYLNSIIEELKGAHEEVLSNNEELQSVNEEIETGKEELQSSNEELVTVNEQLQASNTGLTQANADLRNLLSSIEMPIVVLGPRGEIRMFTPSARRLFNFLASDIGRPLAHVRSNLEFENLHQFVNETVASGAMRETETRDRDGNWYLLRITPSRDERDQVEGAILTLVDIGNRKRVEEERENLLATIRGERAQLEMVIQCMPSAVIVAEAPSGNIILANGQVQRVFGGSALAVGDPVDRIHVEGFHPDGTAYRPEEWPLNRALQTGEIVADEAITILRDGARVLVRASAAPIRDHAGHIVFAVVTYEEISDVQALRERLAQTEKLAQSQRLETIGRLAGGVAHDFNNLLTVITGYTQFVLDDNALSSHLREQLGVVVETANRAAALTSQLLAFGRRQTIHRRVLDLNQVIATTTNVLRRLIGEHIELQTRLTAEACPVDADAGQIEQIIMNLVTNARDALGGGGTITIETGLVDLSPGEERSGGRYVLLAITDTGTGIDEETRIHIFEPFYTTKGFGKGSGLGLASVFGIVKQHKGDIRVESELGKGTRFEIFLPCAEKVAETEAPDASGRVHGSETILVVEDEEGVRLLVRRSLETLGYTVLEARNGRDALRVYQEHGGVISLVVTDVVMPEMHGQELATRLKRMQPGLKVIYMSGYPADAIGQFGVVDTDSHFLGKPFTSTALALKVREALDLPVA